MGSRSRLEALWPWLSLLVRLGLAGVVGYAGISKVGTPALSVEAVSAYQLFGDGLNQFIGHTLPLFEIALAALLLVGLATRYTGVLTGLLMAAFIVGIVSAWARGLSIDCGCFGGGGVVPQGEADYVTPLLRDFGFLLMATWLVIWPRSVLSADRALGQDPAAQRREATSKETV